LHDALNSLRAQARSILPLMLLALGVTALVLGAVLGIHYWRDIPLNWLTRDPAAVADRPFYIGVLSQAGIFFWAASATICFFSALVIPRRSDTLEMRRFLVAFGVLTLVLGFDDVFLVHEEVFPVYVGVPEEVVIASYGLFGLALLVRFYRVILETDYLLLGAALGFFALSILFDFFEQPGPNSSWFEDAAKTAGIVYWLAYFSRVGAVTVSGHRGTDARPSDLGENSFPDSGDRRHAGL
jgi:hypothetical protein